MAAGSYERKEFTGGAQPTSLAAPLNTGDSSFAVATGGGSSFPDGSSNRFVIVIGRGTASEEKILVTSRATDVFQIHTRGYDNTANVAHGIGETVEHALDASTIDQANRYVNLQTVKGAVVAHDGTNAVAVPVGSDNTLFVADSGETAGVAYKSVATLGIATASSVTALDSRVTTLEGKDIDITLTGGVTGTGTISNLGDVSFATTVTDDSHNHVVGNIDSFTENVQDIVGGMVSSNTESGISVVYQNGDGTLDFTVTHNYVAYTPVLTASTTNPTLGTGAVVTGSYCVIGDMVHYIAYIKFGTSGVSAGSGEYYVSLPVSASTSGASQYNLGTGYILALSPVYGYSWYGLAAERQTATTCSMFTTIGEQSEIVTGAFPFSASHVISLNLMYRKA